MKTHGLAGSYRAGDGCRCKECTQANTDRTRIERLIRRDRLLADPTLTRHGTKSTYTNWMCRCLPCSVAHAAYLRERRRRKKQAERAWREMVALGQEIGA